MRNSAYGSRSPLVPVAVALLMAATLASRLPFVSRMLYGWDSGNFALALNSYNVVFHQPQPPGYPIYVAIAWLVDLWVRDANASYVYLSVGASAGSVLALYLLTSRMYGAWIGLASALLLSASVGFWGYGEIAYPYVFLAFLGSLVAWMCYLMWQGNRSVAVLSGLSLGVAAGIRPDLLVFLGPLWLASIFRTGGWRSLAAVLVLLLTCASWAFASIQLSGGWLAYQQAGNSQSAYILDAFSVAGAGTDALRRNGESFIVFLKQMGGIGLVVAVYFVGRFITFKALVVDRRLSFLLLWSVPPLLVYLLLHIGDPGYLLSLLPALCIVTAVAVHDIAHDAHSTVSLLSSRRPRLRSLQWAAPAAGSSVAAVLLVGIVAWNVNAFLWTPGPARLPEIRTIDTILDRQLSYARNLESGSFVVLAKARFGQLRYYLPTADLRLLYDEYQPGYRDARNSYQIPAGVTTVLIMDFGRVPVSAPGFPGHEVSLSTSLPVNLWRFDVKPGDTIEYGYDYFAVSGRS